MKQLFSAPFRKLMDGDNKYSRAIKVPQYVPSDVRPELWELCDTKRYTDLTRSIAMSDVPEDVKKFLMLGATRHIVFNYAKIADYYAHATPEIQRLLEESALVIIDVDDAIANGYVKLSQRMRELIDDQRKREKS